MGLSKEDMKAVIKEELSKVVENLNYRERCENFEDELRDRRDEIEKLRQQVMDFAKERPTQYEKDQWEAARADLKKLKDIKALCYNQGYAAAYLEVTNKMQSGVQIVQQTGRNY